MADDEEESGMSAASFEGGSVEAETRAAINWSIMASYFVVKAAISGLHSSDSLSGREAADPEVLGLPLSPINQEVSLKKTELRQTG